MRAGTMKGVSHAMVLELHHWLKSHSSMNMHLLGDKHWVSPLKINLRHGGGKNTFEDHYEC